ncbi:unnamed protein product, partial [Cochlearia groenlandica]
KSLIVHMSTARIVKFLLREISYVRTPVDHSSFNSCIKGCRKTSRALFGCFGPGTKMLKKRNSLCMHILG